MSVKPLKIGQKFFVTDGARSISKPKKIVNTVENNLDVKELFDILSKKIDSINISSESDIYGESLGNKRKAIDIDIKREISIGKVDKNAIKSEEIKGKVKTKIDKLKELRRKNGS